LDQSYDYAACAKHFENKSNKTFLSQDIHKKGRHLLLEEDIPYQAHLWHLWILLALIRGVNCLVWLKAELFS